MEKITSSVNNSMNAEVENFRSHKRVIRDQNEGFKKVQTKDNKKSETVVTQEATAAIKKIDEVIDDARSRGPSGLPHLGAISDAVDRPIEVYDEKGRLKYVIGDTKDGEPVKVPYHKPNDGETIGHYTLTNCREPFNQIGGGNMCLYNVIAEQTGHDPNHLKNSSLNIMENNKEKISEQAQDITRLEMYSSMKLAMGGVEYSGIYPDDAGRYISNSSGKYGLTYLRNPGHAREHASFQGNTDERLKAISEKTNRIIEIYDSSGNIIDTIDKRLNKDSSIADKPVQLVHHKTQGDSTTEYFTTLNDEEKKYSFHDPREYMKFYDVIGKQTGCDPAYLKSETSRMMKQRTLGEVCVENAAIANGPKTGFLSEAQLNYVTHYALQSNPGKDALKKLNEYERGMKNPTKEYRRQAITIKAEDLDLPKPMFAGQWDTEGNIISVWPVREVTIVLQHHNNQQDDKDYEVHIETCYPRLPSAQYRNLNGENLLPYYKN